MAIDSATLATLGRQELFAWLELAQQELNSADCVEAEAAAEKLCDQIVDRLVALA